MFNSQFVAGVFLIFALTVLSMCGYARYQKSQKEKAEGELITARMELNGAKQALEVKPKEIIKWLPLVATDEVKKAIKSGTITPLTGTKIDATSQPVQFTCPEVEKLGDVPPRLLGEPHRTPPVTFGVHAEVLLTRVKGGPVMNESAISGVAHIEGVNEPVPISFDPTDVDVSVTVDSNIQKAFKLQDEPFFSKHTALACPGVSLTYNPLNDRAIDVALTCGYSFVWF